NVTESIDPRGVITLDSYDLDNRLIQAIVNPGSGGLPIDSSEVTKEHYNPKGELDYTVDPKGFQTDYGYDDFGRTTPTVVDVGTTAQSITTTVYNKDGEEISTTDNTDHTDTEYNADDRPYETVVWAGTATAPMEEDTFQYFDNDGNVTKTVDAMGIE